MDKITTVGLDLAKQVIAVHAVDARGMLVMRKVLRRDALLAWSAALPPCVMAMEACGGAHHWARELTRQGHTVRIIAAEFVKPFGKSGKNDANDAEAICTAVRQANMRFVAIKSVEQQAALCVHRLRQGLVEERTALINRLRGLLTEFGIVAPLSPEKLRGNCGAVWTRRRPICRRRCGSSWAMSWRRLTCWSNASLPTPSRLQRRRASTYWRGVCKGSRVSVR